jgi:hypothetical protein
MTLGRFHGFRSAMLVVGATTALAASGATSARTPTRAAATPDVPCVRVWGEARYRGLGYEHVVHLENGCEKPMVCDVATDVNPAPQRVALAPSEATAIITFVGSPAREFVPRVQCRPP